MHFSRIGAAVLTLAHGAAFTTLAQAAVAPAAVDIKPGPSIYNQAAPRAPQLENTGIWQADPILVSGSSAYRKSEFLYQDFLYDDRGATTNAAAGATNLARSGRYTYPTNVTAYYDNIADIVEVRLKLTTTGTAFRITFNSMSDPALVGTTIALGGSSGVLRTVPFGANAVQPAAVFVTLHGNTAVVTNAVDGTVLATVAATADLVRRQLDVVVPFAAFDPRGNAAVRVAAAAGLWDTAQNRYLVPATAATATAPGGAGTNVPNPPAFFNVAYRFNEPDPSLSGLTRWRDGVQGSQLATTVTVDGVQTHDLSPFGATVDFVKLASGVDDDMPDTPTGVKKTGFINRFYSSRYEVQQGVANPATASIAKSVGCTPTSLTGSNGTSNCVPQFSGRLQPYAIYVPVKVPAATGYGLIADFHGGGDNYQRNLPVTYERQASLGERGTGSIVFSPQGRGQVYWWYGQSGVDIYEVIADLQKAYRIDAEQWVASGISHGGYATWKQTSMFPDLFAVAMPHVPCPTAGGGYTGTNAPGGTDSFIFPMLDSLRNVPVIVSAGESDTTCNWSGAMGNQAVRDRLDALGYRYDYWSFVGQGHIFQMPPCLGVTADAPLSPSTRPCGFSFNPDFLDIIAGVDQPLRRVTNPAHITYAVNDGWNEPLFGLVGDHAYWISSVKVRNPTVSPYGQVDVVSRAYGVADPVPNPTVRVTRSDYTLNRATFHDYNLWSRTLNPAGAVRPQDRIEIKATNIGSLVIDPVRARITCNAVVDVRSDGPLDVVIHGCLKGDVNLDDVVGCADLSAARTAIGRRQTDANFVPRADMDDNGVIDIRDIAAIARLLPAGAVCS